MNLMYKLVELGERFNRPVPDATVIRRQAQAVKDAVKVRIQPVADYLYMETDQEKFHVVRDFPDLTPLWPLACYMWAMPRFFRSEGQILPNPPGVGRVEHNGWAPDCWHNILVNPARSGGGVRDNGGQNG